MNPNFNTTGTEILYMDKASSYFLYKDINISSTDNNPLFNTLQQIYDEVST